MAALSLKVFAVLVGMLTVGCGRQGAVWLLHFVLHAVAPRTPVALRPTGAGGGFKIASARSLSVVLSCIVGDLLVKQSQDHPVHIPRSCSPKLTYGVWPGLLEQSADDRPG